MAFEIGRFYYGIREYESALRFYRDSSDNVGQHHVTFHNMGLCYYSMGEGRHKFKKAIKRQRSTMAYWCGCYTLHNILYLRIIQLRLDSILTESVHFALGRILRVEGTCVLASYLSHR